MLLSSCNDISRVLIGYQFHFGVGIQRPTMLLDCEDNVPCFLHSISKGCYRTSKNRIKPCNRTPDRTSESTDNDDIFLSSYQKTVDRRIRAIYRGIRDSMIIKLDDIPISNLRIDNKAIVSDNVSLTGIISIQNLGICTISLWLDNYKPQTENEWRKICDSEVVSFTLTHTNLNRSNWTLMEFVRYLSALCHKTVNPHIISLNGFEQNSCLRNKQDFADFLKSAYETSTTESPISYEMDSYPLSFIQYNIETDALNTIFPTQAKELRLFLNHDTHWNLKKEQLVQDMIENAEVSTRESIHWLVTLQGSIKLCSRDLGTTIEESFNVMLLETDVVLTMKYFLSSIMQNLSRLSSEFSNPIKVSEMKDNIFTTMDNYFNINLSHNDQTMKRIDKFKEIFRINTTYKSVSDRLEILSVKISNENSAIIEKQQVFLAIVFGLFGSLSVVYIFLQRILENSIADHCIFISAFLISAVIAGIIYFVAKKMRLKK